MPDRYEISINGKTAILQTDGTEFTSRGLFSMFVWKDPDDYVEYEDNYGFTRKAQVYNQATNEERIEYAKNKNIVDNSRYSNNSEITLLRDYENRQQNLKSKIINLIFNKGDGNSGNNQIYESEEINSNEEQSILTILNSWIEDINRRENLSNYYADKVNYYSIGVVPKSKILDDKRSFYNKWNSFLVTIESPVVKKINDGKFQCNYDKKSISSNIANDKRFENKVRSILILEMIGNSLLITEEKDETIYYKNKN